MYVFIYTAAGTLPRASTRMHLSGVLASVLPALTSQSVFSPPFPSLLGDAQPARNAVDACISNATVLMSCSHASRCSHAFLYVDTPDFAVTHLVDHFTYLYLETLQPAHSHYTFAPTSSIEAAAASTVAVGS
eukprot:GHVU01163636.1.p1 GENE.GHVU01163636.1~~GHVU01163636.1.p1  ORF type:complete len:132 (-),score=3.04 GHVU01163636.1:439-834(-)